MSFLTSIFVLVRNPESVLKPGQGCLLRTRTKGTISSPKEVIKRKTYKKIRSVSTKYLNSVFRIINF